MVLMSDEEHDIINFQKIQILENKKNIKLSSILSWD